MQFKKLVPLKKVIINSFGKEKASKYLRGIEINSTDTSNYSNTSNIYQEALSFLYSGDMDKAINYVIFGLDLERNNKLLFNLCKNMTFLLSKHLVENNSELYRKKYNADLEKGLKLIRNKIDEIEKKFSFDRTKISRLQIEIENSKPKFLSIGKFSVTHMMKKRKLEPIIKIYETELNEYELKIQSLSKDMEDIESIAQVEEDVRVLGLIIEVCVFPAKFEWLVNKSEKSPENVV
ncbi:MAG: hypothetical protein H7263_02655 [Candidatus Sericytochromatia bacterium]|nr:hypothetical protein [Candidatus Sericytochromatia bacterium]